MAKGSKPGTNPGSGGKPGGIGKYFDKALYTFEFPYRAVSSASGILPPSDPRADINDLTASATPPTHRRSYDPRVGGYYRFTKASSQSFELALDIADDQPEVFVTALVRPRGTAAGDSEYLFGCHSDQKSIDWRIGADRILAQTVTNVGAEVISHSFERNPSGSWVLAHFAYKLNSYHKIGINGAWLVSANIANTSLAGTGDHDSFIGFSGNAGEHWSGDCAWFGIGTTVPTDKQLRTIFFNTQNGLDVPGGNDEPPGGGDVPPPLADEIRRMLLMGVG